MSVVAARLRRVTTEELLEYQRARYVVAPAAAEKVRWHGGLPRETVEAFGEVREFCGWPEPRPLSVDRGKLQT